MHDRLRDVGPDGSRFKSDLARSFHIRIRDRSLPSRVERLQPTLTLHKARADAGSSGNGKSEGKGSKGRNGASAEDGAAEATKARPAKANRPRASAAPRPGTAAAEATKAQPAKVNRPMAQEWLRLPVGRARTNPITSPAAHPQERNFSRTRSRKADRSPPAKYRDPSFQRNEGGNQGWPLRDEGRTWATIVNRPDFGAELGVHCRATVRVAVSDNVGAGTTISA